MPIVAIIDVIASRKLENESRKKLINDLDSLLKEFNKAWRNKLIAKSTITGGDSIEVAARSWIPIISLLHALLLLNIKFRVSIGAGELNIIRKHADECDGPAFWKARDALEKAKSRDIPIVYSLDKTANDLEREDVKKLTLAYSLLLKMSHIQRKYCYDFIWRNKTITEIARKYGTTKSNISMTIKKSMCRLLKRVILGDSKGKIVSRI